MANDRIRIEVQGDSRDLQTALEKARASIKGVSDTTAKTTRESNASWDNMRRNFERGVKPHIQTEDLRSFDARTRETASVWDRMRERFARPLQARIQAEDRQFRETMARLQAEATRWGAIRKTAKFAADTAEAEAHIEAIKRQMRELARERVRATASINVNGMDKLALANQRINAFGRESATATTRVRTLGDRATGLNNIFGVLGKLIAPAKFGLLGGAIDLAARAVNALLAGTIALTGELTRGLIGGFAAGAVAMSALAQGALVGKLAFSGVMQAINGSHAAMKKLTPAAKDFVHTIQDQFLPEWKKMKSATQEKLFTGLTAGLFEAEKNFPIFRRVVVDTGKALGDLARQAGTALGSKQWGADLKSIGERNVGILRTLGAAAGHVATAVRDMFVAAGPAATRFSHDVESIARHFEEMIARARASGALERYFSGAYSTFRVIAKTLGDVAMTLINIGRIGAREIGGSLLTSLSNTAAAARRFTESASGAQKIRQWFADAGPPVRELGRLTLDLGRALLHIGSAPGFTEMVHTLRVDLLPSILRVTDAFQKFVTPATLSTIAQLANLLAAAAPTIGKVFAEINKLIGAIVALAQRRDAVGSITRAFVALGAAAALKFVGAITGIRALAGAIGGLAGFSALIRGAREGSSVVGTLGRSASSVSGDLGRLGQAAKGAGEAAKRAGGDVKGGGEAARTAGRAAGESGGVWRALGTLFSKTGGEADVAGAKITLLGRVGRLLGPIGDALALNAAWRKIGDTLASLIDPLHRSAEEIRRGGAAGKAAGDAHAAALRHATIEALNFERTAGGLPAVIGHGRTAVAQFAQEYSRIPAARRILLYTNAPDKVVEVANLAQHLRAIGLGKYVAEILAHSKNAEDAIHRMQALGKAWGGAQYGARLTANDSAAVRVVSNMRRVLGLDYSKNWLAHLSADDQKAMSVVGAAINRIRGSFVKTFTGALGLNPNQAQGVLRGTVASVVSTFTNPRFTARLFANPSNALTNTDRAKRDAHGLEKVWRATLAAQDNASGKVDALHRKLDDITRRRWTAYLDLRRNIGLATGGPVIETFAPGGQHATGAPVAPADFANAPVKQSQGGRFSSPTFLVGEERRPEFVIATNPRYRKANVEYLDMAANALGMRVIPGAGKGPVPPPGIMPPGLRGFASGGQITAPGETSFESMGYTPIANFGTPNVVWRGPTGALFGAGPGESLVPLGSAGDEGRGTRGGSSTVSFSLMGGFWGGGPVFEPGQLFHHEDLPNGGWRNYYFHPGTYPANRNWGEVEAAHRAKTGLMPGPATLVDASAHLLFWQRLAAGKGARSDQEWASLPWQWVRDDLSNYWGDQGRSEWINNNVQWWQQLVDGTSANLKEGADAGARAADRRNLTAAVDAGTSEVFRGVGGDLAKAFVGRFAQGGRVTRDGFAYVHRDETIAPDPQGGYGRAPAAPVQPPHVKLTIDGDLTPLMAGIRAEVDGRATKVVAGELGRKSARLARAPGASGR